MRNEHLVAIFRARDGRLVDLGLRADGRDRIHRFDQYVYHTNDRFRVRYGKARVLPIPGRADHALELIGRVRDTALDLEVRTRIQAPRGGWRLTLETTVTNHGALPVLGLGLADATFPGNTRWFVPGHGLVRRSLKTVAHWLARREAGHVFALVSGERAPGVLRLKISEEAFNPTAAVGWKRVHLAPGATLRVRRHALFRKGTLANISGDIQRLLGGAHASLTLTTADPIPPRAPVELEVWRRGAPILTSRFHGRTLATIHRGSPVRARLVLPGAGGGPFVDIPAQAPTAKATLRLPTHGHLRYRVTGKEGRPLPARLAIRGVGDTPTPQFGDDGTVEGAVNTLYSGTGRGSRLLRPGRYEVWVTRGIEYGVVRVPVTITAGRETPLWVRLDRQIDTNGALGADLHLHANPSMDSNLSLRGRLTQLAAVGVEYAVATDHNAVTDYAPVLQTSGLGRHVVSDVGVEITTRRASYGHFNVFPLPPGAPVPGYFNVSPHEAFAAWRKLPTRPVIQVNHPRMGSIGFLNQVDFDRRQGRAFGPGFSRDFDAMEVFNGDYMYRPSQVEANLKDWYTMLNLGFRFTATGNSDAHKLGYQEAGYPRTFVLVAPHRDDPTNLRGPKGHARPVLHQALKSQRAVVSSGPYPTITTPGSVGNSTSLVGGRHGKLRAVTLRVQAACWVPVSSVELVANGRVVKTWKLPKPYGGAEAVPIAATTAPDQPRRAAPCNPVRFSRTVALSPDRDTWYVLVARSRRPLPVLRHRATAVFGFTNPVYIDADGDGRFQAPGIGLLPPTR